MLIIKTLIKHRQELLEKFRTKYYNQQTNYNVEKEFDFESYEAPFPNFDNQDIYNEHIKTRGTFRKKCKKEAERIAESLADQIKQSVDEVYKRSFKLWAKQKQDTGRRTDCRVYV